MPSDRLIADNIYDSCPSLFNWINFTMRVQNRNIFIRTTLGRPHDEQGINSSFVGGISLLIPKPPIGRSIPTSGAPVREVDTPEHLLLSRQAAVPPSAFIRLSK